MFVVKCENGGSPWWLDGSIGDPGRTVVLQNSILYETRDLAEMARDRAIKDNPSRNLHGRLEVVEVCINEVIQK